MDKKISIPVALVVFNRLDCVKANINAIRTAEPPRLYIISDGPRNSIEGEDERVAAVRDYIENNIDWDCELIKIYSDFNMGCDKRSETGYTEVFSREEMAILIEDDAIAEWSFFPYCESMLTYYKDDERIMMVTGHNRYPQYETDFDYLFSAMPSKLMWGTWRRAWNEYRRVSLGAFEYDLKWCDKVLSPEVSMFYKSKIIRCSMGLDNSWDAIWDCAILINKGLGIVPRYNLMSYMGSNRDDATHPVEDDEIAHLPIGNYTDDIRFREGIAQQDEEYDHKQQEHMLKGTRGFYIRSIAASVVYRYFPKLYRRLSRLFVND